MELPCQLEPTDRKDGGGGGSTNPVRGREGEGKQRLVLESAGSYPKGKAVVVDM
jgi:hypothetical protein